MLRPQTPAVLSLNGTPQLVLNARGGGSDDGDSKGSSNSLVAAGDATQRVMQLLGAQLRIRISDGRVVVGAFHCFDKHQNVILTDTREYLPLHRTNGNGSKKGGGKHKQQQHQQHRHEEQDKDEEDKELWKSGTSRALGMALVPGKHIVYIKVERSAIADASA